ncbi:putative kelch-type beta propeller [Helianthus debilis subsp. tardiflorus]
MLYFSYMWVLDHKTWVWNKVKKGGMPPGPRAGFSMCVHKNRAMLYGGVVGMEAEDKKIKNEETHAPFDTSDDPMEVVTNDEDENMDCDIDDISSSMDKNIRVNGAEVVVKSNSETHDSNSKVLTSCSTLEEVVKPCGHIRCQHEDDDDDDEDSEDENDEKDDSDEEDDDDMEELRKDGFNLAESLYRELKPILDEVPPFLDKIFLFGLGW